ncbi:MAG: sodium ion-translocating decarboxylase subunit beta, partial [Bacteroidales bacterium]|nr:sodium ion-translocating decarboxylase subunit beta [Bacteroidales bacterium]
MESGITSFFAEGGWKNLIMLVISCFLIYLAIVKKYEPLLLLPIAFGMLLSNLPGAGIFHNELWVNFLDENNPNYHSYGAILREGGLLDILYIGVKLGLYPCIIFIGIGAMTDFGPLIANPKSLLLGAAAQFGIFITYLCAIAIGFAPNEAGSIGIIGGADGPTAIFLTSKLAPNLLG